MPDAAFDFRRFPATAAADRLHASFFAAGQIGYATDKILPTGHATAVFTFGAPHRVGKDPDPARNAEFDFGWIEGVATRPTYNTPLGRTLVVGLFFPPHGLARVAGRDMATLTDRVLPATEVLPPALIDRVRAMARDPGNTAEHRRLHEVLGGLPATSLPGWLPPLWEAIVTARGDISLDDAYAALPVSRRTASAAFRRATGYTPKQAARIHRMLALLEAVDPRRPVNWTALAHAHGFYDQAHFNREFRRISGLYPSRYLEDRRRAYPDFDRGEHVMFTPNLP